MVLAALEKLWKGTGATLVLVTHDPALASRASRRVHLLDGRIASDERDDRLGA